MKKNRLEAFSDGVIAIIITIMVLELKVPHGNQLHDLKSLLPIALSYVLSFVNVGLYWNNHHHLFQAVEKINGKVLWANTHLLFWLSLMPFSTAWMGENDFTKWPVILYGIILMMSGVAYFILVRTLLPIHQKDTALAKAIGNDFKGKFSVIVYFFAVIIGYWSVMFALILYVVVAATWLIPDKRFEKEL